MEMFRQLTRVNGIFILFIAPMEGLTLDVAIAFNLLLHTHTAHTRLLFRQYQGKTIQLLL